MPANETIKVVSVANLEYYKTLSDQVYQTENQVDAAIDEATKDQMNYKGEVDNISAATSIETYPENSVVKDANNVFYLQTGSTSVAWVELSAADVEVAWNDITGKPSQFPPSAHDHSAADITSGRLATARGGVPSPSSSGLVLTSTGSGSYDWSESGNATLRASSLAEDLLDNNRLLPSTAPSAWDVAIANTNATPAWYKLAIPTAVKEFAIPANEHIDFQGTDQAFNLSALNYSFGPEAASIYHSTSSTYYRVPAQRGYRISATGRAVNVSGNPTNAALNIRVGTTTNFSSSTVVAECISGLWAGATGNITQLVIPPVYVPPASTGTYRYIFLGGRCTNGGEQLQQSTPPTASRLIIELLPDLD